MVGSAGATVILPAIGADMQTSSANSDAVAFLIALASCWSVLQRFTSERWRRRFGAIKSPSIAAPAYRTLFLLVVVGLLLITVLPEAAFVLPAVDAVGLDIVTLFAAFELRHYLAAAFRSVRVPAGISVLVRKPALLAYSCTWSLIWLRTHTH